MKPIETLLLLAASLPLLAGDFNYAAYEPVVLDQLVATIEVDPRVYYYFDLAFPRYQSTAVFTGRSRAISQGKKDFIAKWIKAARLPGAYYDIFSERSGDPTRCERLLDANSRGPA